MQQRTRVHSLCLMLGAILLLMFIMGCNSSEPSWKSFEGSAVEKDFPVPKDATKTEAAINNSKVNYVRYSVKGLTESSRIPEVYQQVIESWGWKEDIEDNTDTMYVFTKNDKVVQLTVHKDTFTVLVPKELSRGIIHGLESDSTQP